MTDRIRYNATDAKHRTWKEDLYVPSTTDDRDIVGLVKQDILARGGSGPMVDIEVHEWRRYRNESTDWSLGEFGSF